MLKKIITIDYKNIVIVFFMLFSLSVYLNGFFSNSFYSLIGVLSSICILINHLDINNKFKNTIFYVFCTIILYSFGIFLYKI